MLGNQKVSIDEKGRLTIPTKFRKEIGNFVVVSFEFEDMLVIRKKEEWEKWSNLLIEKGNFKKAARILQRKILGNSAEISIDSKGRILLPKTLIEISNLSNNVQIVGVGNKLEIVSESSWEKMMNDKENNMSIEEAAEALEDL